MISTPTNDLLEGHAAAWPKSYLWWIVIVAFTLRAVVRLTLGQADFWTNGYTFFFDLAQNIASGRGIGFDGEPAAAFRVPLYPIFLAAVTFGHREFIPVSLFQSMIVACTRFG
jgi:hypothetical protein